MSWSSFIRRFSHGSKLIDLDRFRRPFPEFEIRPYTGGDFERCSEIYQLNEKGRFPDNHLSVFQESLTEQETLYVVAELDGKAIGVGGLVIHEYSDEVQVACLVFGLLDPAFHGKGYGTAMLAYRLALLPKWKSEWYVTMTSAGNGTETFFKKLGFCFSESVEEDGVRLDAYYMRTLKSDLELFRRKFRKCGITVEENPQIPRHDQREEFETWKAESQALAEIP